MKCLCYHSIYLKIQGFDFIIMLVTNQCDQDIEYTGQIGEFFETTNKECWLGLKWMFRPEDTVNSGCWE